MKKPLVLFAILIIAVLGTAQNLAPKDEVTIRLLTDSSGIDDESFNAAAQKGILEFYGDTYENQKQRGTLYDIIICRSYDNYITNIQRATNEGYDLIAAIGFTFADALETVAAKNPKQKYLIVDVDWIGYPNGLPNVIQAVFAEHEGSFLVGAAAALKARANGIVNPHFGFIGGVPGHVITKFHVGYVQGVLSVIPDAQFVDYYANNWGRPDLAYNKAKDWYDAGVFAIYSAAGHTGNGVITRAKEYRLTGKNVWAIGVDTDQHNEGLLPNSSESAVLTSMIKRIETSLIYSLNAVKNNNFHGEVAYFDVKTQGVDYSTSNSALTQSIKIQLENIKNQIASGEIKVASTYREARRLPGFPQNLGAVD